MSFPTQRPVSQAGFALSAIAIALLLYLTYFVGTAFYNVFFHPLRKFPGPKTWAWSRVSYTLSQLGGKPHKKLLELHNKYGPVVRIAHNELSIINPDAWKDVLGHRTGGRPENGKDPMAVLGIEHSIVGSNHGDHTRMRRILSHGFSLQAIADQQSIISTHIGLLFQRLHENCGGGNHPLNMVSWYNRVTFDVISDLSWGEALGSLKSSQDHPWIRAMEKSTKTLHLLGHTRRFPQFSMIFEAMIPKDLKRLSEWNFAFAAANVEKRIDLGESRPDFMGSMIRQTGDKEMSREEIEANAFILMLAGSETSSTTLAAATYFLTLHPEALAKLEDEILSTFQSEEDINVHSIQNLPYLTAVMDETLRVNPAVPHASPRVIHKGGDVICGDFVPEGTIVSVHQWAMYRSSKNFTLPDSFIPERWLGDPRFATDRKEASKPFSFGPRNCIGKNLATTEIRIILARMIWNFEMRIADDSRSWTESQNAWVIWEKPPLNVYLTPRSLSGSKTQ